MKNREEVREEMVRQYMKLEKDMINKIHNASNANRGLRNLHGDSLRGMFMAAHAEAMDRTRTDTPGNSRGDLAVGEKPAMEEEE